MKKTKNRITAISIAILLTISIGASMILVPTAQAHSPAWQIPTFSFCSVSPNPIGVGQIARVNFWVDLPPPTASGPYGDRWQNITVRVKEPNGTTQTLGPFTSDDTGGSVTTYTPNVVGNYTFQMTFGGQTLLGNNLTPGTDPSSYPNIGDYFQPSSSNVFTLTVQQQPIQQPPVTPLPTNYWTRPIYALNNNWYSIAGNWLGLGGGATGFALTGLYNESGNYNPYTIAPNTAHILWTKPEAFGGIIGGEYGGSETANFMSTSPYEPKFAPIIMNGILYYTMYPGSAANPAGWAAVNLQTGQTLWTKNTTDSLLCGQILNLKTPNQFGGIAYLWSHPLGPSVTYEGPGSVGSDLNMWDALTGNYILTITGSPGGESNSITTDAQGDLIFYYVNSTDYTINMWNSTRCINLAVPNSYGGPNTANNWLWRPPQNAIIDFGLGIQWSASLATNISGTPLIDYANGLYGLSFYGINSGVLLMAESVLTSSSFESGWIIEAGYSAVDGSQLWITNRTETPYSLVVVGGASSYLFTMGSGVYVEITQSALSASGYSLTTGQPIWGPVRLPNANPFDSLGLCAQVANGTIYIVGYGGDVYAYNILTGALKWHYHTPSGGFESPYGVEPLWVAFGDISVADGKLFAPEGHEYGPPLFHGAQQLALNITNGSLVWSIDAFDVTTAPAISDGVMTTLNSYDNQIYAWGMGPSKTTVNAPDPVTSVGSPIVITGTVTDISAGSQQEAVAANFPNGLPCVSDASMSQFMEAVYMQQSMPTNLTGVPVTLSVVDSNGNYRTIGTTTTDPTTGTFAFNWKPNIPGNYTVIATFAGSQSYYSSTAKSYFYASAPAAASPTASPISFATAENYVLSIGIAIIVIIIIGIAALAILIMRKHP